MKVILDLCGGTGAWSKPYKKDYLVYVITLPYCDLFETEFKDGRIFFKNRLGETVWVVRAKEVYGILAAPTCTMFSLARTTAKTPRDIPGALKLVDKCYEIVRYCQIEGDLKFWAMENPKGLLRKYIGKPALEFNPSEYGDTYTKKTDLWGFFNMPKKAPREMSEEEKARCAINNRELPEIPEGYVVPEGMTRNAVRRSITSEKFAQAFYKANR